MALQVTGGKIHLVPGIISYVPQSVAGIRYFIHISLLTPDCLGELLTILVPRSGGEL